MGTTVRSRRHLLDRLRVTDVFFLHKFEQLFLLEQLSSPLVLPCVFDEVFNNNVEAGADTDEAAAGASSTDCSSA